jgi:hypothetical protein
MRRLGKGRRVRDEKKSQGGRQSPKRNQRKKK